MDEGCQKQRSWMSSSRGDNFYDLLKNFRRLIFETHSRSSVAVIKACRHPRMGGSYLTDMRRLRGRGETRAAIEEYFLSLDAELAARAEQVSCDWSQV